MIHMRIHKTILEHVTVVGPTCMKMIGSEVEKDTHTHLKAPLLQRPESFEQHE